MDLINKPEVKRVSALVLNSISILDNSDGDTITILNCNNLIGDELTFIVGGEKMVDVIDPLVGKIIDVVYKECIANVTQYIDQDTYEIEYHKKDHKSVVDITKTNNINLLLTCTKLGLKDLYNELKELNK